jgi:hypothetical protein
MKFGFSMAIAGAMCMGFSTSAVAGPLIYATKVEARCKILPDGTATTVSVTLENTASNFYGQSLSFKFTPTTSGIPQYLPHPADVYNPVTLAVSPGVYTLEIRTGPGPSASSSQPYPITVPAGMVMVIGSKKFCQAKVSPSLGRAKTQPVLNPSGFWGPMN